MTEIRVKRGSRVTVRVDGPAVVRIEPAAAAPLACHEPHTAGGVTMAGFSEAIALVAGQHFGIQADPSPDIPPESVGAALVIIAAAFLRHLLPADNGAQLLADLAKTASEHQRPAAEEGNQ